MAVTSDAVFIGLIVAQFLSYAIHAGLPIQSNPQIDGIGPSFIPREPASERSWIKRVDGQSQ